MDQRLPQNFCCFAVVQSRFSTASVKPGNSRWA